MKTSCNKENIVPKQYKIPSSQNLLQTNQNNNGKGTQRQNTTPSKLKSYNQFEVKISKRSISFIEENLQKQNKEPTLVCQLKNDNDQNQSDSEQSQDSINIWQDECRYEDLFDLFQFRFNNSYKTPDQLQNNALHLIKSYKKLFGYNIFRTNIGKNPFYHMPRRMSSLKYLNEQKQNTRYSKLSAKFKLQESKLPFGKNSFLNNQITIYNIKEKK
ncbi:unnamed protein product (macronuclear) [Paramecium tetraurelia]|uniref:Uncharacterized protein n=1 Tax=Paramecium tetraurelia TaxID=5888 RepID=A0CN49_PARTE|nr:uncharacterized protein GSPATT00008657001 [Paramecium tetraurelia]CAK72216.1 unnamed protein product [Paramecium tetraurelia]|eukprot:XP_001439613.1 hypothetical protein (macronuclear) [Paramecium tetraurelia strain d4-2]